MTKSKNKSKTMQKRAAPRSRGPRTALDGQAAGFARMLADPCNAPLVHPVYPGGDSGYLFRAESFATVGTTAGDTAGIVHWTPGYVNASTTQLLSVPIATSSGPGAMAINGNSPGVAFLTANARACRCVAACMKVTYPGSESTRSGRVHYGATSAGMLDLGTSASSDNVATALQHFSRTPADTFELIWKPSIGDTEFNDPTEAASAVIRDRKAALTLCWAGLPSGVGLTIHFTAIYEWTPAVGTGVGHNPLSKNTSLNTLDQVLDYLIRSGFTFVRGVGHAAGGGLGAGMVEGIARTFGLMPARRETRNIAYR
jgi:hypothetical protein